MRYPRQNRHIYLRWKFTVTVEQFRVKIAGKVDKWWRKDVVEYGTEWWIILRMYV